MEEGEVPEEPPAEGEARPKKNKAVALQRKNAYVELLALDGVLKHRTGKGLEAFRPDPQETPSPHLPRTLALHMDEGSPAYAALWNMLGLLQLRRALVRDFYRQAWASLNGASTS